MSQEFHRIRRMPPYVFAEVNNAKARARADGEDIIDLGMGNPDGGTPAHIVAKLVEAVQDPRTHRYSTSKGIPGLRRALAGYYARRFGVTLDPETEVVATLGSKEGLANLAAAITSPGDTILVPNPSYPIHQFGFIIAGASVRSIPAIPDDTMLEALDRAVRHSVPKPTALIVNFPSNPTAYLADLAFYKKIVAFCRKHEIYILSDLAYSEIYFGDEPPPSILQVDGARDITVEFTSLSKTYSMPGWRMGFAAGNARLIGALARMKSYLDYGAFTPIQIAATAALNGPQECVAEMRALYKDRRDVLVRGLVQAGWDVPSPEGSMFAWAPIPPAYAHLGSVEFSKLLLSRAKVAVAPGIGFGEYGDTHVRIALVENTQRLRQAVRNIKAFLQADSNVADLNAEAPKDLAAEAAKNVAAEAAKNVGAEAAE
jgi:alanine-synthesizing transaminase